MTEEGAQETALGEGRMPEDGDPGEPAGTGSFYGWLWRRLPGPWPARLAVLAVAAAVVVVLLFLVVFPWVEPRLPFNQVTVGAAGVPADAAVAGG